jgi:hypothetical protein
MTARFATIKPIDRFPWLAHENLPVTGPKSKIWCFGAASSHMRVALQADVAEKICMFIYQPSAIQRLFRIQHWKGLQYSTSYRYTAIRPSMKINELLPFTPGSGFQPVTDASRPASNCSEPPRGPARQPARRAQPPAPDPWRHPSHSHSNCLFVS